MRGVQSRALLICQRGRIVSFECSRRCHFSPCADNGLTSLKSRSHFSNYASRPNRAVQPIFGMRLNMVSVLTPDKLNLAQLTDLEALLRQYTTKRTARAGCIASSCVRFSKASKFMSSLRRCSSGCTNVLRSKVEPMKGRRAIDSPTLRRNCCVGPDPPDQRLHRSHQRLVSSGDAKGARLHALRDDAHGSLSHCWQARFLGLQSACPLSLPACRRRQASRAKSGRLE